MAGLLPLLAGCGGGGQVTVSMRELPKGAVSYKPGDTARFRVVLLNNGPGDAPGVTVVVTMPSSFHYKSTDSIIDTGSARTQPLDARVGSSAPQWGFWDIAAPSAEKQGVISIDFTVQVEGTPDTYNLLAHAEGDNTAGTIQAKALSVQVTPAASLQINARVDKTSLNIGDMATYRVTITNSGSATASGIGLLVALPPVMVFQSSVLPFEGNASRDAPTDPLPGAVELFFGGFTIPAASGGGPGYVTVAFKAQVVGSAQSGTYTLDGQATDDTGDIARLSAGAAVTVKGAAASPGT